MGKHGALTVDNPKRHKRDLTIAKDRLAGLTYNELAKKHKLSKPRIFQILSQDQIKDVIDSATNQIIQLAPLVVDTYQDCLNASTDKAIRLKAADGLSKIMGITPSHATSPVIQSLYIDNSRHVHLSDAMHKLLTDDRDNDVIDVDCES